MARFLMVEVEVGESFAKAANDADSTREVLHYRLLARRGYNTATRMAGHLKMENREAKTLAHALVRLNSALRDFGDPTLKRR